jgi:ABC-2 type transport system ATP-binding protein
MDMHGMLYKMPTKERKERIKMLLEFVELWDRKDSLVKQFSGGMKRRLEIARGFMHKPKILFLDEPTVGLDPQTRNHIWSYLKKLNQEEGLTVFLTTHHMEEADRVSDRIAIIDHGKIITEGSAAELKQRTNTTSLEEAFLALTGKEVRAEEASGADALRAQRRMWRR